MDDSLQYLKEGNYIAVICLDFDNTIVVAGTNRPLAGAREAINLMREKGHKIVVDSCNNTRWIKETLDNADIRYDRVTEDNEPKPIADIYIDDKGFHFRGNWEYEVNEVLLRLEGFDNRKW